MLELRSLHRGLGADAYGINAVATVNGHTHGFLLTPTG
jgi:hypothetical protein